MILARRTTLPVVAVVLLSGSLAVADGHPAAHSHPSGKHTTTSHKAHKATHPGTPYHARKRHKRPHGQQAIDGERARQIQEALLREHYLSGEPSGTWDSATQDAMRHYQAQQGWQTKTVPDSRALIRLGLGPDHGHLLNPESAMTTEAAVPRAAVTASAPAASTVPAQSSTPASAPVSTTGSPQ